MRRNNTRKTAGSSLTHERKGRLVSPGAGRILLILPCTKVKPYTSSPTWGYVITHIEPWLNRIDLAAIDCITNPKTGTPFGLVPVPEQRLAVGLDEKPDPKKFEPLVEAVRHRLTRLKTRYLEILAYVNVKVYWQTLAELADEFGIVLLPSVYRGKTNWSVDAVGASPLGIFRIYVDELVREITTVLETCDPRNAQTT